MLALTRKAGETIIIGEGENRTVLRIVELGGGRVRLGFEGSIKIIRGELENKPLILPE